MAKLMNEESRAPSRGRANGYDIFDDQVHFPLNHRQVRSLIGRLLTQLDAMALPDRAHAAAKTLFTREVWDWWVDACENSVTSYQGCIAPITVYQSYIPDGEQFSQRISDRWDCEQGPPPDKMDVASTATVVDIIRSDDVRLTE